jgi:hypothetical protein
MTSSRRADSIPVFCDWLDVTFAPTDAPYPAINRLLMAAGFDCDAGSRPGSYVYRHDSAPGGTLVYQPMRQSIRFSASGSICALMRSLGIWGDYLSELSSSPHSVTRLDAAIDLAMDGADLVDSMRRKHVSGSVSLSRKSVATSTVLGTRPDGRETGTWYAGKLTKARFTARVYDKAWERLCRASIVVPPCARVEVTAKGGDSGATLRDAEQPAGLFWHIAAPALLKLPEGAPVWTPNRDLGWVSKPRAFDPAAVLRRRVESAALLDALALLSDDLGPQGRSYLLHLIEKRLEPASDSAAVLSQAVAG